MKGILPYISVVVLCLGMLFVPGRALGQNYIVVNKTDLKLRVYDGKHKELACFPVAVGTNYGDKKEQGDCRTPEGTFLIKSIEASIDYHYDFGDGRGLVKGAYGPRFIRLAVPGNNSIGIHGTLPEHQHSIPGRESHGCVRMKNNDILVLCKYLSKGMKVTITPDHQ